jgi:DNA-binding response OmpR family regulator
MHGGLSARTLSPMTKTPLGESVQGGQESAKPPRPLRILIADDDRDAVLTLMMVLRHEGHEVRGVYKGIDVLRSLADFAPDAVILDIYMPELNGYDVARGIASRLRQMPLMIGVSGVYKGGSDRILAELTGFDHYLTKPYDPSDVLRLLAPLRVPGPPA